MTKIRSSTIRAEEIPARPATGIGAPAVPRSTSSVVMLSRAPSYLADPTGPPGLGAAGTGGWTTVGSQAGLVAFAPNRTVPLPPRVESPFRKRRARVPLAPESRRLGNQRARSRFGMR